MNPKVRIAVSFLETNLHRDIYIAEGAKLVGLSRSRFCQLFKSEVGMPFIRCLKKARLERSLLLIETSFEPVKAVAFEVGYNDPTHFEREFKKTYGVTPSQYRAHYLARMAVEERPA